MSFEKLSKNEFKIDIKWLGKKTGFLYAPRWGSVDEAVEGAFPGLPLRCFWLNNFMDEISPEKTKTMHNLLIR